MDIGGPELLLILLVALVMFGGKKIPELAQGLGNGIREFKKAQASIEDEFHKAVETPAQAAVHSENPEIKSAT
jgi:sec-independent protein translocase protein TatA